MFLLERTKVNILNSLAIVPLDSITFMERSLLSRRPCCVSALNSSVAVLIEVAPAKRIMSLNQPTEKKMSKSDLNPRSRILITDSREDIVKKIKAAVTDSEEGVTFDPERRPAIANLANIMYYLDESATQSPAELLQDVKTKSALKDKMSSLVDKHLEPIRERYHELMDPKKAGQLQAIAEDGATKAIASAEATMAKVRHAIGFA
jgi:tryptophanyl-tRNA synthetase